MKIILFQLGMNFMIFSLMIIPAGCNRHDTDTADTGKNRTAGTLQMPDTGEKPYDKEADQLALRYQQKSVLSVSQLKRGADFVRIHGVEKLIEILQNPDDPRRSNFVSGDFYIWIMKTDFKSKAIISVHPINKAITGRDFLDIKDADGKEFIKDIIRIILYKEKGWVSYKWAHPRLKKAQEKLTYFEKINDYVLCDGFYLKD